MPKKEERRAVEWPEWMQQADDDTGLVACSVCSKPVRAEGAGDPPICFSCLKDMVIP